jgi:hypothetical protein
MMKVWLVHCGWMWGLGAHSLSDTSKCAAIDFPTTTHTHSTTRFSYPEPQRRSSERQFAVDQDGRHPGSYVSAACDLHMKQY